MDQMMIAKVAKWILVIGGLAWAYEGYSNTDIIESVFGNLEPVVDMVFGLSAVFLAYFMVTKPYNKKKK